MLKYVYMLRSLADPEQRHIGLTTDLQARLKAHNAGKSPHRAMYKPWEIVVAIRFHDDARAAEFERYLKSGSGRAFANKHLW